MTKSRIGIDFYNRREGMVYIAVLGVALIIAVISMASLHVARLEIREAKTMDSMARARLAARSGVECLQATLKSNLLWRTVYTSGATANLPLLANSLANGDSFQFMLTDSDGNLNDNSEDAVTIRCIGLAGNARHVIEVQMQPTGQGLNSLSASLHAGSGVEAKSPISTNQVVSSNGHVDATDTSGSILGNAQAAGVVVGTVSGTRTNGMAALDMPDPTSVFEYYLSNGTPITYSQLSSGKIERTLLSAGRNPFGSQITNAQGIYVIDCQGQQVKVKDARIQGTLVFVNATNGIEIDGSILWEPVIANFPAMMVQGDVKMKWDRQTSLSESSVGVNLNPASTPYNNTSDSDTADNYAGLISGLIYVTGDLEATERTRTSGVVVVGGDVKTTKDWDLTYKSVFYIDAPPGFGAGIEMELVPGTWKQVPY